MKFTDGGLPRGRPTLFCGAAGCGNTLFAMTFFTTAQRNMANREYLSPLGNNWPI